MIFYPLLAIGLYGLYEFSRWYRRKWTLVEFLLDTRKGTRLARASEGISPSSDQVIETTTSAVTPTMVTYLSNREMRRLRSYVQRHQQMEKNWPHPDDLPVPPASPTQE